MTYPHDISELEKIIHMTVTSASGAKKKQQKMIMYSDPTNTSPNVICSSWVKTVTEMDHSHYFWIKTLRIKCYLQFNIHRPLKTIQQNLKHNTEIYTAI